jgi:RNA polymerase sigma-70 factor (ECF subfamily)
MDLAAHYEQHPSSDAELVRSARAGDQGSLGRLLVRYRAQLYAQALNIVGYRTEAEDAVQDTMVTALVRLADLREPQAFGAWLHAILHNRCLMALRRRRRLASPDETEKALRDLPDEECLEARIESRELRDWVWAALAQLPEAQRATMMLRHFGSFDSYEEISAILGIPLGTVRSRLFDARTRMARLLLARADREADDSCRIVAERAAFYTEAYRELGRGGRNRFLAHYTEDLHFFYAGAGRRGRSYWDTVVDGTVDDGVEIGIDRVIASGNVTVLEGVFRNPPDDPFHCPPGAAFVLFHRNDRTWRLHVHHAPRPPRPPGD